MIFNKQFLSLEMSLYVKQRFERNENEKGELIVLLLYTYILIIYTIYTTSLTYISIYLMLCQF